MDDSEVVIVSYPKSGRTWLRTLLGKAFCEQYGVDEGLLLDTYTLTKQTGVLTTRFTHDGSEILDGKHFRDLDVDRSAKFQGKKVLFIVRDLRDVLVSSYFQAVKRADVFEGEISAFIRDERFGVQKIVQFLNIWHVNQFFPDDFLLLTYEDMHKDTERALRQALDFMGAGSVTDAVIDRAVEFASFESMRRMEKNDEFGIWWMRPGDVDDPESYKVRRGKIGGYVDYLSSEDIAYVDETVQAIGCPFLRAYYG